MSLIGCGASPKKINNCNFKAIKGAEFVLRQRDYPHDLNAITLGGPLSGYFLHTIPRWRSSDMLRLEYKEKVNTHGKIYKMPPKEDFPSGVKITQGEFTPIILEDCTVFYSKNYTRYTRNKFVENYVERAYFIEDLKRAKGYIGKNIWKKLSYSSNHRKLATNEKGKTFDILPYEKLEVIGIDTRIYNHIEGYTPFFLKVKDGKGNEGLVKYSSEAIYRENPFNNKGWSQKSIRLIKYEGGFVGMNKSQAILAWGLPLNTRITKSLNSTNEFWFYGNLTSIMFSNGIVSMISM